MQLDTRAFDDWRATLIVQFFMPCLVSDALYMLPIAPWGLLLVDVFTAPRSLLSG